MRARKDLELGIEMQHNVNLTAAHDKVRGDGTRVEWTAPELREVQSSLSQLPAEHVQGSRFERLHRTIASHAIQSQGGVYEGDRISIYDNAHRGPDNDKHPKYRRAGGDEIGWLEYSITHEIGHDAERQHASAFKKFQKAGGWETVEGANLPLPATERERLELRRRGAVTKPGDVMVEGKDYTPAGDKEGRYHRVDDGVIPESSHWRYAKTNAQEHFAEVYAKAVHAPEVVYQDMVIAPSAHGSGGQISRGHSHRTPA